jgi:hypothetical protein
LKATLPISTRSKRTERPQALLPDPANPFGAPLVNALAALPAWPFASSDIPRQAIIMIKTSTLPRAARSVFAFALTLLTGCALIQDDPGQVPLVNPQQAELAQVIHLANSGWPTARWWEGYQDPQLNMLVNRALQNSPTMQAARLRISQSQSTVELAQSAMGAGHRRGGAKPPAGHQ